MFHIHWKGYGLVVGLAGLLGLFLTALAIEAITHDQAIYRDRLEPKLCAVLASAGFAYGAVKLVEKRHPPQTFTDPLSGQERTVYRNDSLFLVPIRFLPYTFLTMGAFVTLVPALIDWYYGF